MDNDYNIRKNDNKQDKSDGDINYTKIFEKSKEYFNLRKYDEAKIYSNLALISPGLDETTKIHLYYVLQILYNNHSTNSEASRMIFHLVKRSFEALNKIVKINDEEVLARISINISKGIEYLNPDKIEDIYLIIYLLYYSKDIYKEINIMSKEYDKMKNSFDKAYDLLEKKVFSIF
jgi:hypothetical protein